MNTAAAYDRYPLHIRIKVLVFNLSVYALGLLITFSVTKWLGFLYGLFIAAAELHLMYTGCRDCYYYDKWCAFSRGKLVAMIFRRGGPERFACRKLNWHTFAPDMALFFIPLLAGIVGIILQFSWLILVAMLVLIALNTAGNAYVRGKLSCNTCMQGRIGCPALEYFEGKGKPGGK